MEALGGVVMELQDCSSPILRGKTTRRRKKARAGLHVMEWAMRGSRMISWAMVIDLSFHLILLLLAEIIPTADAEVAFKDCDYALLVSVWLWMRLLKFAS